MSEEILSFKESLELAVHLVPKEQIAQNGGKIEDIANALFKTAIEIYNHPSNVEE